VSDTPRTDAAINQQHHRYNAVKKDGWSFARTLERENAAMREAIKEAYKLIDVLYMDALDNHKESWPRARKWMELWKEVVP
jgi:hypothetical protein